MSIQSGGRRLVCDGCGKKMFFSDYDSLMDFIHNNNRGWTYEKYDDGGAENWCPDCSNDDDED
jgi:hypothetical protein